LDAIHGPTSGVEKRGEGCAQEFHLVRQGVFEVDDAENFASLNPIATQRIPLMSALRLNCRHENQLSRP
jgi:hypothetical protein